MPTGLYSIVGRKMKYWITHKDLDFETCSTNYLQVAWGKPDECKHWDKDSLFIEGEVLTMVCKIFLTAGCKKCLPGHIKNCLPWSEKTPYRVVSNLPYHAHNKHLR